MNVLYRNNQNTIGIRKNTKKMLQKMVVENDFKSVNDLVADMLDKYDCEPVKEDNPRTNIHLKNDTFNSLKELSLK